MVSHPETGSDSPIGSDQDRGRDNLLMDNFSLLEVSSQFGRIILISC